MDSPRRNLAVAMTTTLEPHRAAIAIAAIVVPVRYSIIAIALAAKADQKLRY
jgi:hypothetical protein